MLLSHRSGIYNYTDDDAFFADNEHQWTPREIVDFATAHGPVFAPGASYAYSNTNYILLGMILEQVTGDPAGDVIHARAIDPAGLAHTFIASDEELDGTLARGFEGTTDVTDVLNTSQPWVAGSFVATGADLVDWMATYLGSDAILDDESRAALTADPLGGYGLGIMFFPSNGTTA